MKKYTKEMLQSAILISDNWFNVMVNLGVTPGGDFLKRLKYMSWYHGFDTSHFKRVAHNKGKKGLQDPSYIIAEHYLKLNGPYINTCLLKNKLILENIKQNKCEKCNILDWNNEKLVFQLHHINGNDKDNRIKNLQILCPNCHSQTNNWGTKNREFN